ncbi:MAG: radical SAM protein [Candidatus Zixiibacteriota bacterium]
MKMNNFKNQREKLLSVERNLISTEAGRISKRSGDFRVALGFPNTYEVGMSNLGFQTIYRILNQMNQVTCERFFLFDFPPYGGTRTLESNRNIKDFDLIAFSIPFELDYPHVLELLKLSQISLLSSKRKSKSPLIIAGGVAPTLNPEILAPFLDCILIGEAEEMICEFMERYLSLKGEKISKEDILYQLSKIKGVYVPQFYQVNYHENGCVKKLNTLKGVPGVIESRRINLEKAETFSPVISPYTHFKNTLLIETARGCIWGCRFCATGHIHQPCRFYKKESILAQVRKYSQESKHVGLIGAVISDHPDLEDICQRLHSGGFEIGTSSLRVDMLSPNLLKILVDSGLRTLTLAPEAGTERMWRVTKKNIDKDAVLKSAKLAREADIQNLKLYFIIGLPFEEIRDIEGIVDLIREVHEIFVVVKKPGSTSQNRKGSSKRIILSINPFVPKPHTPFQWCAMNSEKELKEKLGRIEKAIKNLKGIQLERKSIREAILQGILSMGNRNVGMGIFYRVEENLSYPQAWKKAGVNASSLIFEPKSLDCTFPWDILDTKVSRNLLRAEHEKAQRSVVE